MDINETIDYLKHQIATVGYVRDTDIAHVQALIDYAESTFTTPKATPNSAPSTPTV